MFELIVAALVVSSIVLWTRVQRLEARLSAALVARVRDADVASIIPPPIAQTTATAAIAVDASIIMPVDTAPASAPRTAAPVVSLRKTTTVPLEPDDIAEDRAQVEARPDEVPAPAPKSALKRGGFEELFGSKLPIWAGGITLAVAGLFIVKYSIDTGLLSPTVRVVLALLFAAALVIGAEISRRWRATAIDPRVAQALAGAGIAVAYAAVLLAANLYQLIGEGSAFVALAAITAGALGLALRFGAACAVLGLVGGLAAPALAGGTGNVATLAIYLVLAVTGLSVVARMQGWRWLSAAALVGGFGWGSVMLALEAIDPASALAIGGYLLVLALAVPFVAGSISKPQGVPELLRLLPPAAAAVQLAILIGLGGYRPLVWGLYALLALGVIVLARIDARARQLPPLALAIGAIVVALWPVPPVALLVWVLVGSVALFGIDAALRLVRGGTAVDALQLGGALVGAVALGQSKLPQLGDNLWGTVAALAAVVPLLLVGKSRADKSLVAPILAAAALVLLDAAAVLLVSAPWLPAAMAVLAVGAASLALPRDDPRIAVVARLGFVAAALAIFADPAWFGQVDRLLGEVRDGALWPAALRYALVALAAAACAAIDRAARAPAQLVGALLGALAIAQVVPPAWIALTCAIAALAVGQAARLRRFSATAAIGGFAVVVIGWALWPFVQVLIGGIETLVGVPLLATALPTPRDALLLLVAPAVVLGAAVGRGVTFARKERAVAFGFLAAVLGAGALVVFKQLFALHSGAGFVARGMAERLVLTTLLYAAGWAAWQVAARRDAWAGWLRPLALGLTLLALARTLGFDVLIYNPLWRAQAVGALPLADLLAPAYLLPLLWLWLAKRHEPRFGTGRVVPLAAVQIVLVLACAAAAVRQAFHGSIFALAPLPQGEDIAFSLVAIAVAVGFLLWGIRVRVRAWRIASLVLMLGALGKVFLFDASGLEGLARIGSFVALGFSLIGIGWLYSRYLTLERPGEAGPNS